MFETSLALAQNSLYLNPNNHLVKYLISLNLNSLNKKELALNYMKSIPQDSYSNWNAIISTAELYLDLEKYNLASEYLLKHQKVYPKKTEILYKLGELYHVQKNTKMPLNIFPRLFLVFPL